MNTKFIVIIIVVLFIILLGLWFIYTKDDDKKADDIPIKKKKTSVLSDATKKEGEELERMRVYINGASDSPPIPAAVISEIEQQIVPFVDSSDMRIMDHTKLNQTGVSLVGLSNISASDLAQQDAVSQETLLELQTRKEIFDKHRFVAPPVNSVNDPAAARRNDAMLNYVPESLLVAQRTVAGISSVV